MVICKCAKSLQWYSILRDPAECSLPSFSVDGILQARMWSGLPCTPPGNLHSPGTGPVSLKSPALAGGFFTTGVTWKTQICISKMEENSTSSYSHVGLG